MLMHSFDPAVEITEWFAIRDTPGVKPILIYSINHLNGNLLIQLHLLQLCACNGKSDTAMALVRNEEKNPNEIIAYFRNSVQK